MEQTQQLTPRAYQIMDYYIQGLQTNQIAERLQLTAQYVATIINAPNFQHSLAIRRAQLAEHLNEKIVDGVVDATNILKENARKAADRLVELLDSESQTISLKSSTEILDRVGVQPKKGSEISAAVVVLDEKTALLINETLKMKEASLDQIGKDS